ncbi:MAG TPA: hypothetical protein H9682_01575 [Firmicutes bacterium]|nr:hypothetical protein [Bacillota bacterium]
MCFAWDMYRHGRGAMAQRGPLFSPKDPKQVQKNHAFAWMQRRGASALADCPIVFAEDHVIHIKADIQILHHISFASFLSGCVYSIPPIRAAVQRQTGRTFSPPPPAIFVILPKLYEQIMYKM